ncbi:IclR family transcriptional regulator [Rhodococcus opacus]|uniref:IclR family transcriptional regulator n=1 Tax=Rhodococcus opacus TaxID=37919 RepID=UPI00042F31B6|nr:IclR family transcriptional regulator [Rhodococcus opacus]AHK36170.1 putative HTH-type transcriptional regulator yagI [Rhodococcus opacus PD630]UDH01224.1 IclR family transcriptional regulator [Rhodococcus opacus PD630]
MVARAASVLFSFTSDCPEMPLREVADKAGLAPSTTRRLLVQLAEVGLIRQNPATQHYSLSLQLARLGAVALGAFDIVDLARPVMADLTTTVGESSFLGRLEGSGVVYLAVTEARTPIRIATRAGDIRPAHVSSVGKIMLAALTDAELDAWLTEHELSPVTPNAHITSDSLRLDLAEVQERGYALNYRESSLDFASVAAPIHDHTGAVVAAIAVSGPAYRIPPEHLTEIARDVTSAAARVTERMGGEPDKEDRPS